MFRTKKSKKQFSENINFQSHKDDFSHLELFLQKFPIHCLQILIPNVMKIPECIEETMSASNTDYILIKDLPLISLVDYVFIDAFMKKGTVTALSIGLNANSDNFAVIVPTGKLVISLEENILENLNLVEDVFKNKKRKKQAINKVTSSHTIDLRAPYFKPYKQNYMKTRQELEKLDFMNFNIILNWTPYDVNISSSSLQEYFQNKGFSCSTCECEYSSDLKFSVQVPKINSSIADDHVEFCNNWDFLEWIGVQMCKIDCVEADENIDDFINSYRVPEPSINTGQIYIGTWKGLIVEKTLHNYFSSIKNVFHQNKTIPFIVTVAHGFYDSWFLENSMNVVTSCDKIFCVVIFPDLSYWLYSYIGTE